MAGAIAVGEATTMAGVAATIVAITVGKTSPPLMVRIPEEAAFGRLFSWSQSLAAPSARHLACWAIADFVSTAAVVILAIEDAMAKALEVNENTAQDQERRSSARRCADGAFDGGDRVSPLRRWIELYAA